MKPPCTMHGRLYLGATPTETWSIADPSDEASYDAYGSIYRRVFNTFPNPQPEMLTVSRAELQRVLALADAWLFLGTYPLGTGVVLNKLRDVRAALRKMGKAR